MNRSTFFRVFFVAVLILECCTPIAIYAENSRTPPRTFQPMVSISTAANLATTYKVLLIEDLAPWLTNSNGELLNKYEINFKRIAISDVSTENLGSYSKIIIAGDQTSYFYRTYMANKSKFDDYVMTGGILEWHLCGFGWNSGDSSIVVLPGGAGMSYGAYQNYNYVELSNHPLMDNMPTYFWGSYASHGYFMNSNKSEAITTEGWTEGGLPTLTQYRHGSGCVIASSQPLEFGYYHGQTTGTILSNIIPYYCKLDDVHNELTVNIYGKGTVIINPEGTTCNRSTCTIPYPRGTSVTLSGNTTNGSVFSNWAGACSGSGDCQLTMNTSKLVSASFIPTGSYWSENTDTPTQSNIIAAALNAAVNENGRSLSSIAATKFGKDAPGVPWWTDTYGGDGRELRNAIRKLQAYWKKHGGLEYLPYSSIPTDAQKDMRNQLSSYSNGEQTAIIEQIRNKFVDGNIDIPIEDTSDERWLADNWTLTYLDIRAQCKEFADRMVQNGCGATHNYNEASQYKVNGKNIRPGMYAFLGKKHAAIISAVFFDESGNPKKLRLVEANWPLPSDGHDKKCDINHEWCNPRLFDLALYSGKSFPHSLRSKIGGAVG